MRKFIFLSEHLCPMLDKKTIIELLKHLNEILKIVWHQLFTKEKSTKCTEKDAMVTEEVTDAADITTAGDVTE